MKRALFCSVVGLLGAAPASVWLDAQTPANWNVAGAALLAAPGARDAELAPGGRCDAIVRAPTSPEDNAIVRNGWSLFGPYQRYDRTAIVTATASADGMCRPDQYQGFVFVDGTFAGTLSPVLMRARSDAGIAGLGVELYDGAKFSVTFTRYSASDALCCPHASTSVSYEIDTLGGRSVVAPTMAQTTNNPQ